MSSYGHTVNLRLDQRKSLLLHLRQTGCLYRRGTLVLINTKGVRHVSSSRGDGRHHLRSAAGRP